MKVKKNILKRTQALPLGPSQKKEYSIEAQAHTEPLRGTTLDTEAHSNAQAKVSTPGIIVKIRPDGNAMEMLVQVLKKSHITYKFFPIVRLLLEKKDRFQVIISVENPPLFWVEAQQQVFLSLEQAQSYMIQQVWPSYFEEEKIRVDAPKGIFTAIGRCGITQILIGPPNYHLYNTLLKQHYQEHLKDHCTWEEFLHQIRNEHDEAVVQEWMDQISYHYRYHFKPNPEICFDQKSSAKNYLIQHLNLNEHIKPIAHLTLSFDQVQNLQDSTLREIINREIQREMKVPVKLGSYCRAFLHHSGFHIYRKGKKSEMVTYICSVKRNVRDEFTFFTEKINKIIDCIEKNPYKTVEQLIPLFLGALPSSEDQAPLQEQQILELKRDLILLIKQGYVTQYEDGALYISPPQTLASKQNRKKVEAEA